MLVNGNCVCPAGQVLSSGSCIQCPVSQCSLCSTTTTCDQCLPSYTLSVDQTSCTCGQTRTESGNSCICAPNYIEYNNVCYLCTTAYCLSCSQDNVCNQCMNSFTLTSSSTCTCPDPSYQVINQVCACPQGTNLFNNTCITCSVTYCQLCQTTNICTTCQSPFVPQSNG